MPSYERPLVAELVGLLSDGDDLIVAIFGPRQSGKTTAIRQALLRCPLPSRYHALDDRLDDPLDDPSGDPMTGTTGEPSADPAQASEQSTVRFPDAPRSLRELRALDRLVEWWQAARREARERRQWVVLVLDEIQHLPDWSRVVKGLWDTDRRFGHRVRAVVLGSTPMAVQSGLTESLAGRFFPVRVSHWSFGEMSAAFRFTLDEFLFFGGYPAAGRFRHAPEQWADYLRTAIVRATLERDVVALTRVDRPALLRLLLERGVSLSGQIVSYRKLLGDLRDEVGNATTVAGYLSLLERIGLLVGLPRYARQRWRRRSTPAKLIALNTGLMTADAGVPLEVLRADRAFRGRVVETAVGAHLWPGDTPRLGVCYWREGDDEVDFVVTHRGRVFAIEVKSGPRVGRLSGMDAFRRRHPEAIPIVLGGPRESLEEFLSTPVPEWLDARAAGLPVLHTPDEAPDEAPDETPDDLSRGTRDGEPDDTA